MKKLDYAIKRIGVNRGAKRLYFQTQSLRRCGFPRGTRYKLQSDPEKRTLVLHADPAGDHVVSGKGDDTPVIDLNSNVHLQIFDGLETVRVVFQAGKIHILPVASEAKMAERNKRLQSKIVSGERLSVVELCFGGGVAAHAVHHGLQAGGLAVQLSAANEIDADLIEHAVQANDVVGDHTALLAAPMQEVAADEWLMSTLGKADVVSLGIPCSGASSAGKAKRGIACMEEHPQVGHLVVAALAIIGKLQPAVVMVENVENYATSASSHIFRNTFRDWGYSVSEVVLNAATFGCLEARIRWFMVAHPQGVELDLDSLVSEYAAAPGSLGDVLDQSITPDDERYREVAYLKAKEQRDAQAGKGFGMQFITPESTHVPVIRKGYFKGGSSDPRLVHPTRPELSRLLTGREHARVKQVPEQLVQGLSDSVAHVVLGQGVAYKPVWALAKRVAERVRAAAESLTAVLKPAQAALLLDGVTG